MQLHRDYIHGYLQKTYAIWPSNPYFETTNIFTKIEEVTTINRNYAPSIGNAYAECHYIWSHIEASGSVTPDYHIQYLVYPGRPVNLFIERGVPLPSWVHPSKPRTGIMAYSSGSMATGQTDTFYRKTEFYLWNPSDEIYYFGYTYACGSGQGTMGYTVAPHGYRKVVPLYNTLLDGFKNPVSDLHPTVSAVGPIAVEVRPWFWDTYAPADFPTGAITETIPTQDDIMYYLIFDFWTKLGQ